jgi:hypothetical protein
MFGVQIFRASVKPIELQWVKIEINVIPAPILFILILIPCKNLYSIFKDPFKF